MTMTYWATLRCNGVRPNGRRCTRILAEVNLVPGSGVRIHCRACGSFTEYERATASGPMVVTTAISSYATVGAKR